jgi:hypothetical protein
MNLWLGECCLVVELDALEQLPFGPVGQRLVLVAGATARLGPIRRH